jgi:hypothetical protein
MPHHVITMTTGEELESIGREVDANLERLTHDLDHSLSDLETSMRGVQESLDKLQSAQSALVEETPVEHQAPARLIPFDFGKLFAGVASGPFAGY